MATKDIALEFKKNIGVNIGSSRGSTQNWEHHYETFLKTGKTKPLASPTTTLGNISSWVAQDLVTDGINFSHSITCSTGMHALLNGIAWINAKMSNAFLVGASEACLTPFTFAQMKALKLYTDHNDLFPCKPLDHNKTKNTLTLGDASIALVLSNENKNSLAKIIGIGYATEKLEHHVSLSSNAKCFQESMKMALDTYDYSSVDAIILHAPGTVAGDKAEINAIENVFKDVPLLTSNKWKIGHTFGASGLMSLEMAIYMITTNNFINIPYISKNKSFKKLNRILINAVGFGGNAVSILIEK